jgi:PAS domain S-box-containing protein
VRVSLSPIFGAAGRVIGASSFTADISDHKRTQEVLVRTEARLRAVMTTLPVVVFAVDFEGRFTLCEGRDLGVLGLRQGQLFGESMFSVWAHHPSVLEATRRALAGETFTATLELGDRVLECWFSPLREAGGPDGATAIATDITERKRVASVLSTVATMLEASAHVMPRVLGAPVNVSNGEFPIDLGQIEARLSSVRTALESDAGLGGRLEEVGGAGGLVQMLALIQSDGVLQLGGVKLHLQSGRIAHVEHSDLPPLDAILEAFALERGRFAFNATPNPVTPTINFDPTMLALEAARRLDELRRAEDLRDARQISTLQVPVPQASPLPNDSEGVIVLANSRLALEFMTGVGGVEHFRPSLESNPAWSGNKVVLHGRGLKIVVLDGTLNDWASVSA